MSKDPAVLFYTSDFLIGTQFFTDDQVGKYMRALCAQHEHGKLTKQQIDFIVKDDPVVMNKFTIDKNGNFFNKRMLEESNKRRAFCESRRKSITKRCYIRTTHVQHTNIRMEDENEDENRNKKEEEMQKGKEVESAFETFWKIYPKKVGKGAAEKSWKKIKSPGETLGLILRALVWQKQSEQWKKENGQFIPMPATYLNQTRWLDEPPKRETTSEKSYQPLPEVPEADREANAAAAREISDKLAAKVGKSIPEGVIV
jgi:hypothetical protein